MAPGKLFLGGLATSVTTEALIDYFGQFGTVVDAIAMAGRGFGFVTFDDIETARGTLSQEHELDGRRIDIKEAVPEGGKGGKGDKGGGPPAYGGGGKGGKGKAGGTMVTDKIFIGGLPPDCSEEMVRGHFEQYGNLVDIVVMKDKLTGKPRGFGFVQYDNTDCADAVMEDYEKHQIEGKWVECKRATPQDQMSKGGGGGKGGRDSSYGPFSAATKGDPWGGGYGPPPMKGDPWGGKGFNPYAAAGYPGYDPYGGYGVFGAATKGYGAPKGYADPYNGKGKAMMGKGYSPY